MRLQITGNYCWAACECGLLYSYRNTSSTLWVIVKNWQKADLLLFRWFAVRPRPADPVINMLQLHLMTFLNSFKDCYCDTKQWKEVMMTPLEIWIWLISTKYSMSLLSVPFAFFVSSDNQLNELWTLVNWGSSAFPLNRSSGLCVCAPQKSDLYLKCSVWLEMFYRNTFLVMWVCGSSKGLIF